MLLWLGMTRVAKNTLEMNDFADFGRTHVRNFIYRLPMRTMTDIGVLTPITDELAD